MSADGVGSSSSTSSTSRSEQDRNDNGSDGSSDSSRSSTADTSSASVSSQQAAAAQGGSGANPSSSAPDEPEEEAAAITARNTSVPEHGVNKGRPTADTAAMAEEVEAAKARDPERGAQVERAVAGNLDAAAQGRLAEDQRAAWAGSPGLYSGAVTDETTTTVEPGAGRLGSTETQTRTHTRASPDGHDRDITRSQTQTASGPSGIARTASDVRTQERDAYDEVGRVARDPVTRQVQTVTEHRSETTTTTGATLEDGLHHRTKRSEQRGAFGAEATSGVQVNTDAVTFANGAKVEAGPAKADASSKFSLGPSAAAVAVATTVALGPASFAGSADVKIEDGTRTATTQMAGGLDITEGPVGLEAKYVQTDTDVLRTNPDGSTTHRVTGRKQVEGKLTVEMGKRGVEAGGYFGEERVDIVTVPKGTDIASIDVTDARKWPDGTAVETQDAHVHGYNAVVSGGVARLGVTSDQRQEMMTRRERSGDMLSVTRGPVTKRDDAVEARLGTDGTHVKSGVSSSYGTQALQQYDIDLTQPGVERFDPTSPAFNGRPHAEGQGVSNLREVRGMEGTTGASVGGSLLGYDGALEGGNAFEAAQTHHADGRTVTIAANETSFAGATTEAVRGSRTDFADGTSLFEATYDADGDGRTDLTIASDGAGGAASYTFSVQVTEHNRGDVGRLTGRGRPVEGDVVRVTVSEAQLDAMHERARVGSYVFDGPRTDMQVQRGRHAFAQSLARGRGPESDGTLSALNRYADDRGLPGEIEYDISAHAPELQEKIKAREASYVTR